MEVTIIYTLYNNDIPENLLLDEDLAIDTETMGLNLQRDRLCMIQISNGNGTAVLVKFDGLDYRAPNLKKLLLNKNTTKIFHFARFDLAAIDKYLGIKLENIFCTKIASKLVRTYTDYHGLKELCRELLDIQISKQQQSSDWGAESLSDEQMEYASKDVLYLHQLKEQLTLKLLRNNRLEIANNLFAMIPTISQLDLMGWSDKDIFSH